MFETCWRSVCVCVCLFSKFMHNAKCRKTIILKRNTSCESFGKISAANWLSVCSLYTRRERWRAPYALIFEKCSTCIEKCEHVSDLWRMNEFRNCGLRCHRVRVSKRWPFLNIVNGLTDICVPWRKQYIGPHVHIWTSRHNADSCLQ